MHLEQSAENAEFAEWLLKVGNGDDLPLDGTIHFPPDMKCPGNSLSSLIDTIYPNVEQPQPNKYFLDRTILSPRNDEVAHINNEVLKRFPGQSRVFCGADELIKENDTDDEQAYPVEFLNSITTSGLPLAKLELKIGCPLMILRNLAPEVGLCNGTRAILKRMSTRILEVEILGGEHNGRCAFVPHIKLTPSNDEIPVRFSRRQFPVRVAFAMTINKSQGQSVKHVGLDLCVPVFTHGQLYVALS